MTTVLSPTEHVAQRVILSGVSWETYQHLLADFADRHVAHLTYDQGQLEIMVLSPVHERLKHTLATLVELLAGEFEIDVDGVGSTTFRREDLGKGFEPDACFYVQHAERMRGKDRIDLAEDPPPDLVIEIDITSPSLDKFPIFARVGVPEVWRYDGKALSIFRLVGDAYQAQAESLALAGVTQQMITQFIEDSKTMPRTAWLQRVRAWAQEHKT